MANLMQQVMGLKSPPIQAPTLPAFDAPSKAGAPGEFQSVLQEAIGRVEQTRTESEQSVNRFLAGENEEIHNVVISAQRAELTFEAFLQVRNKVVNAYQEIMRMQM